MKHCAPLLALVALVFALPSFADDIKKGDKLQTLINLHPDMNKRLLYTLNYQQPGLIPICSDITVQKISKKKMVFEYHGANYEIAYEGFTKDAGVSFQQAIQNFFGPKCDEAKIKSLSKVDQEGIKSGEAQLGMTKEGVLFAMGRPPVHATPSLDSNYWLYWRNRFGKRGIEFDSNGKVSNIK